MKRHKFRVSLTKRRAELLSKAKSLCEGYSEIHYVYTDINGNLKLRLVKPINRKWTYTFNSEESLLDALNAINNSDFPPIYSDSDVE